MNKMMERLESVKDYFKNFKQRFEEKEITLGTIRKKIFGNVTTDGLVFKLMVYIILIGISYVFLYPLIRMLSMSFMSQSDILDPEIDWVPKSYNFNTIKVAISGLGMPKSLWTSTWFSTLLAIIQTTIAAMTGFAFARYNFKFKSFWFAMILFSFIIPLPVVILPRHMIFTNIRTWTELNLYGTVFPQMLFTLFGQGVNNAILVLIFFNFFKMIPLSLDEAARIDGATSLQVFWHIFIRMSLPVIITVFLFSFVWNWNETYLTSIFNSEMQLIPRQLSVFDSSFAQIMGGVGQNQVRLNESFKMSATLMSMIPLFIIYAFAQRQFIEGIERTGITGE